MTNATKQFLKELKKQKSKNKFLLFLDTPILVSEAINSNFAPEYFLLEKGKNFDFLKGYEDKIVFCENNDLQSFSDAKTNAGIIGVFNAKKLKFKEITTNYLVLDTLQDAGNIGTILRSALACDFMSVILVDCVHISNPKLIRSSAGSVFKLNILECTKNEFFDLKLDNLCYADMNGKSIKDFNPNGNFGLVLGNEGNGVSEQMRNASKYSISLPMKNNLESLNVAVCGGIIMYYITHLK